MLVPALVAILLLSVKAGYRVFLLQNNKSDYGVDYYGGTNYYGTDYYEYNNDTDTEWIPDAEDYEEYDYESDSSSDLYSDWTPTDADYLDIEYTEYNELVVKQTNTQKYCKQHICMLDALENGPIKDLINSSHFCLNVSWTPRDVELVAARLIPVQYLRLVTEGAVVRCNRENPCSLYKFHRYMLVSQKRWAYVMEYNHIITCTPSTYTACQWTNRLSAVGAYYFPVFSIPFTVLFSTINLSILTKLLTEGAGAAMYFHVAEIITDLIFNLMQAIYAARIFQMLDLWWRYCYISDIVQFEYIFRALSESFHFINQCFLTAIIVDRLQAIKKPLQYGSQNHKKRVICVTVGIIGVTLVLFLPYMLSSGLLPLILSFYRPLNDGNLRKVHMFQQIPNKLRPIIGSLSFALVAAQLVCYFLINRAWKSFVKNAPKEQQETRLKQEKDKKKLLIGTIGVNLVNNCVIFIVRGLETFIASDNQTFSHYYHLVDVVVSFASALASILSVSKGSIAVFFHVFFTQSYRTAFFKTKLGRCLRKTKTRLT